jgi:hypothetical protein
MEGRYVSNDVADAADVVHEPRVVLFLDPSEALSTTEIAQDRGNINLETIPTFILSSSAVFEQLEVTRKAVRRES